MRLEEYTQKRMEEAQKRASEHRGLCLTCFHPELTCYCQHIRSFDPNVKFVILIQYREAQKRIATGRISHLCLKNSLLINGYNYTHDKRVNEVLSNPDYYPVVLYPGQNSVNLTFQTREERALLVPPGKQLVVFVIDGTWVTARKIVARSLNLKDLPRICFDPPHPSRYRLRKQPKPNYFSTVEAIHHTIELIGESQGFNTAGREHDALLHVFDSMVETQIELAKQYKPRFVRGPRNSSTQTRTVPSPQDSK